MGKPDYEFTPTSYSMAEIDHLRKNRTHTLDDVLKLWHTVHSYEIMEAILKIADEQFMPLWAAVEEWRKQKDTELQLDHISKAVLFNMGWRLVGGHSTVFGYKTMQGRLNERAKKVHLDGFSLSITSRSDLRYLMNLANNEAHE